VYLIIIVYNECVICGYDGTSSLYVSLRAYTTIFCLGHGIKCRSMKMQVISTQHLSQPNPNHKFKTVLNFRVLLVMRCPRLLNLGAYGGIEMCVLLSLLLLFLYFFCSLALSHFITALNFRPEIHFIESFGTQS